MLGGGKLEPDGAAMTMPDQKEQAEILRLGLLAGVRMVAEVGTSRGDVEGESARRG